jgi:hypothetical protein
LGSSDLEAMLADEFNDIPIMPQINIINSTTAKIRFITVFALYRSLLKSSRITIGYTLLSAYGSRNNKHPRFWANEPFSSQLECRQAP